MIDIQETLSEFGTRLIDDIRDNMSYYGLGNSNLAKELEYEVNGANIIVTANHYWKYAELGRGPGGVPRNFEDILLDWMHKYNVKPNYGTDLQFANAIKWKTIKEGSSIYRGARPERDFIDTAIDDNLDWLEDQLYIDIRNQFIMDDARDEIHNKVSS